MAADLKSKSPGLAILIGKMKPKMGKPEEPDGDEEMPVEGEGLEATMEEFITAIEEKDVPAAVEAFKSLFEQLEMEPHEEAEHDE
jgi:CRISPR/Cas system CSM-associated protein Csm2 small subunit